MARIEASKFSVLKIDDDYDSEEDGASNSKKNGPAGKSAGKPNMSQNAKKKSKAKKKAPESKGNGTKNTGKAAEVNDAKQWDEWAKQDQRFVDEEFQKELQDALLASKLQFEEFKQTRAATQNGSAVAGGGGAKKKNKKEKPIVMSLGEFNQADLNKLNNDDSSSDKEEKLKSPMTILGEGDPNFFNRVDDDVNCIIKRENMQKEYIKQYGFENTQMAKLQKDLDLRNKEIIMLKATKEKLEAELTQVKKRNQQLCFILAQGEMKNKTELLQELEELKSVRDELTEEVKDLTSDLEKERSKSSQQSTTERAKGAKHSGK